MELFVIYIRETMDKKTYYTLASFIFGVIAILHVARVLYGWEAQIGDIVIPMWASYAAILIAGYLSVRGWQFAKGKGR